MAIELLMLKAMRSKWKMQTSTLLSLMDSIGHLLSLSQALQALRLYPIHIYVREIISVNTSLTSTMWVQAGTSKTDSLLQHLFQITNLLRILRRG